MKKAIMLAFAALLVAGAPSALAQRGGGGGGGKKGADAAARPLPPRPEFTTGVVASYVAASRMLKLNTGGDYRLTPAAGESATIHPGDKVQLRWLMKGGIRTVDEASITQPAAQPAPSAAATPVTPDKASTDKPAPAASTAVASPS
jgi:hypothetical protein